MLPFAWKLAVRIFPMIMAGRPMTYTFNARAVLYASRLEKAPLSNSMDINGKAPMNRNIVAGNVRNREKSSALFVSSVLSFRFCLEREGSMTVAIAVPMRANGSCVRRWA